MTVEVLTRLDDAPADSIGVENAPINVSFASTNASWEKYRLVVVAAADALPLLMMLKLMVSVPPAVTDDAPSVNVLIAKSGLCGAVTVNDWAKTLLVSLT